MPHQEDPEQPFSLPARTTRSNGLKISNESGYPMDIDKLADAVLRLARAKQAAKDRQDAPKKQTPPPKDEAA